MGDAVVTVANETWTDLPNGMRVRHNLGAPHNVRWTREPLWAELVGSAPHGIVCNRCDSDDPGGRCPHHPNWRLPSGADISAADLTVPDWAKIPGRDEPPPHGRPHTLDDCRAAVARAEGNWTVAVEVKVSAKDIKRFVRRYFADLRHDLRAELLRRENGDGRDE